MKNIMLYKTYNGTVEFNEAKKIFCGHIIGINASITYSGSTADELICNFHEAVESYIAFCKKNNKKPETAFKGTFNCRVSPFIHKRAVEFAMNHDISLNTFVNMAIREYLQNHSK